MVRSELEAQIAKITGAELKNGRWYLAGRDFSLAMEGIVIEIERRVVDAIEPVVETYETDNKYDHTRKLRLKTEWSKLSRELVKLTEMYRELR